ncbi:MAG: 50S ribosomal protein L32 [Clostridiaceae bacterium]|jgi:large subunit ribosomal protein L32|nr:50S ribosomal protein L32 [Clostridiaceae bacterium]
MAVPKRKTSKARKHSRSANWKLEAVNLVECPQCHEQKQSHQVCPKCGYYDGRQVVAKAGDAK